MKIKTLLGICTTLGLLPLFTSCTYMDNASIQAKYSAMQKKDPSQLNLKHMIEQENYFINGVTLDPDGLFEGETIAVAAFSNKFDKIELVDIMQFANVGTHYGLNLPKGSYTLYVLLDNNGNGTFDVDEVVGIRELSENILNENKKVISQFDIQLSDTIHQQLPAPVEALTPKPLRKSLYYPAGAIRELNDPLFSRDMATLGLYHPAAFLEKGPTMFYALDEEVGFKIPVLFVHGINGSVTDFKPILNRLDRSLYKPQFFYYPSGGDLDQLADLFYDIFLSGKIVDKNKHVPLVIVAHSMGGLIVRQALNSIKPGKISTAHIHFYSLASPLGGHQAAASGEKHGLIPIPSWKDLNPESDFVTQLYRNRIPKENVTYNLLYAFKNEGFVKFGENSDGVVPLSSQLREESQEEAISQKGFNASHVGILSDESAITYLLDSIHSIKTLIPDDHIFWLLKGGYTVTPENQANYNYTPKEIYLIEVAGRYIYALQERLITPMNKEQEHFVKAANGEIKTSDSATKAWIQFIKDNPSIQLDGNGPGT